jgi:regulatory protein
MIPRELKNNFFFKKILKYCSSSIKSESEVLKKLKDYETPSEELELILDTLRKFKFFFTDEDYVLKFVENLSSVKGYSRIQLKTKLLRKGLSSKVIDPVLNNFFKNNEEDQLNKFIQKNFSKLNRKPKEKRLQFLISKGFGVELSRKLLRHYDL